MKKDLQNGRSMIEMLGVLSIIGILTVGGFSLISKTVSENRVNRVIDEVSDLARRTRVVFRELIYDEKPTEGKDVTKYVCSSSAYPDVLECDKMLTGGKGCDCKQMTKFIDNDEVEMKVSCKVVTDANNNKNATYYYVLEISNMSEEVCMGIANGQWGSAATNGFSGINFNKSNVLNTKSVDLGTAATTCADNSTIYLAFR